VAQAKICGLRTAEALDAAVAAGAAAVGFVFFPPSPRAVAPAEAAALAARAGAALRVGLFVDPADDLLARTAAFLDVVQLQGGETPARVADIGTRFGRPVWKAIGVAVPADLRAADDYPAAERLLIDAKPAPGAALPGGNGAAFDWSVLAADPPARPWVLAGGLTAETVGAAIRATGADFVDVSSGVESEPGRKDVAKIRAFVEAARRG
jgi:phosphoribosylanthranilate isomerase